MSAHPSTKYKALMNYMHNDLKISKDDIREWVKEAVEDIAQRYVERQMEQGLVEKEFRNIIRSKGYELWNDTSLDDWVKSEVVHRLLEDVHLKVDIVKSEKKATRPNTYARVIARKNK